MPVWEWPPGPNGEKRIGTGETEQEAWSNYQRARRIETMREGQPLGGDPVATSLWDKKGGTPLDVIKGIGQGLIDPIEGAVQLAEHISHKKLAPDFIRKMARDYRKNVQSTIAGEAGELGGNVAGAFILPGMTIGRGLTGVGGIVARGLGGAAVGAMQPVEGATSSDDFLGRKEQQASIGALATGLPSVVGQLGRIAPTATHMAIHHPWYSLAPRALRATGVGASKLPPGAVAAPAAELYDEENQ
jgi:hypothetical protein